MPEGYFKLRYYERIRQLENPLGLNLKMAFKLTKDVINPQNFQKMNVGLARQFFNPNIASAFEICRDHCKLLEKEKSKGIPHFIRRMNEINQIMSSRKGLRMNSPQYQVSIK